MILRFRVWVKLGPFKKKVHQEDVTERKAAEIRQAAGTLYSLVPKLDQVLVYEIKQVLE